MFVSNLMLVGLALIWSAMMGVCIWLFVLWYRLEKDAKNTKNDWVSFFIPVYFFDDSYLSQAGRVNRTKFFKGLAVFGILVLALVGGVVLSHVFGLSPS